MTGQHDGAQELAALEQLELKWTSAALLVVGVTHGVTSLKGARRSELRME
jgi:hypothetical protein